MSSLFDSRRYLLKLRAYWPWWVALGLLIFIAGNAAGLLLKNKFSCSAMIRVLQPLASTKDASLLDPSNELRIIRDRLTQPTYYDQPDLRGQTIIGQLNLAKGLPANSIEYQNLKKGIASRMTVWPRSNNLVLLEYWDYQPARAYDILDAAIKKWRVETEESIGRMANNNKALLETQLKQAEDRLTSASAAVLAFKTLHPEVIPEAYSEYRNQRDELIRDRTTKAQKIKALQDSISLAEARLQREAKVITTSKRVSRDQPEIQQMRLELAKKDREMAMLLQTFKENHPKVQALKRDIALQKEMIDKAAKEPGYTEETATEANPVWQTHRDELDRMRMELDQTVTMVKEADKSIASLDVYIAKAPAQQAVLEDLTREEALYRTEAADLKKKLVSADYIDSAQFRDQFGFSIELVSAPERPLAPSAPSRVKIAGLSAGMSLGVVAAMVWILMILDLAVRSVDEARAILKMPVLGVVQPIHPASGRRRRKIAA